MTPKFDTLHMKNDKYKHLFFDLDRTLYDFDVNNKETLRQIFANHKISNRSQIVDFEQFFEVYGKINKSLWLQYKKGHISKQLLNKTRFEKTLDSFGINDLDPEVMASEYIAISPQMTNLIPGAIEILDYLFPSYSLHLITNGFSEIQQFKIENSGLEKYFEEVITSEEAGAQKPDEQIFQLAFQKTGAEPHNSLIIGDDPDADILGGINVGMDQVWLKVPGEVSDYTPTYQINNLLELKEIL
jgi:putative hydrolase of the HAD superfamily